jgi:uncharacterized membrane protein YhaH (DUF805 family)
MATVTVRDSTQNHGNHSKIPNTTFTPIPMPNFYYIDANGQKQGLITDQQLKALAAQGVINPQTPLMTDTGHKGLAGQIPSLFSPQPQQVPIPPHQSYQQNPQYSQPPMNIFCSNCGQSVNARAVACPRCGVPPRAEKRFCTNCGAAIANPKQVICLQCGTALQSANPLGVGNADGVDANALGIGFWDIITKKYSMMNGRARRKEFWMFSLWQALVIGIPAFIGFVLATASEDVAIVGGLFIFVGIIFTFALVCPGICLQVRRLHDSGKSGWFWFICLIPYVGGLIMFVLMCFDSQRGDNQYGPNPKGEY